MALLDEPLGAFPRPQPDPFTIESHLAHGEVAPLLDGPPASSPAAALHEAGERYLLAEPAVDALVLPPPATGGLLIQPTGSGDGPVLTGTSTTVADGVVAVPDPHLP